MRGVFSPERLEPGGYAWAEAIGRSREGQSLLAPKPTGLLRLWRRMSASGSVTAMRGACGALKAGCDEESADGWPMIPRFSSAPAAASAAAELYA
jgi:hypothetical protein